MSRPTIRVYPSTCKGKACFRWKLIGANREKVAASEAYTTKAHAERGARSLRRIVGEAVVLTTTGLPI